ncbi:MAG TPA: hypothetical protein VF707_11450, partial [Ardenticatenaceae bacterium]
MRKIVPATIAALTALGAAYWWRRWPENQEMAERADVSGSRTLSTPPSVSGQAQARPSREVPPPDSEQSGRTPRYFVPGEALVAVQAAQPLTAEALEDVAARFEAVYAPVGSEVLAYPSPEGDEWITVTRLRWPESEGFEAMLQRFVTVESQVKAGIAGEGWRVTSWMPNWLGSVASAAPDGERHYTPGGPGAYPRPVPAPAGGLPLTDAPFLQEWRGGVKRPVTLAVLDAFPSVEALEGRALPGGLDRLGEALRRDTRAASFDSSRHFAAFRTGEPFDMSDHGLMTTWLATEVIGEAAMEKVTVEPIRIAGESGVCSAADVIAGLAPLVPRA